MGNTRQDLVEDCSIHSSLSSESTGHGGVQRFLSSILLTSLVMSLAFDMDGVPIAQLKDDGLSANECYPKMLIDDPTFALLNEDPYFSKHGRSYERRFKNPPDAVLTAGKTSPFRKRSEVFLDLNEFVFDNGNSSRRLTQMELDNVADAVALEEELRVLEEQMEQLAYADCVGKECATQLTPVMRYSTSRSYICLGLNN